LICIVPSVCRRAEAQSLLPYEDDTMNIEQDHMSRLNAADATVRAAPDGNEVEALREAVLAKLIYAVGKTRPDAKDRDWFVATALAVRDRIVDGWGESYNRTNSAKTKRVYYLSLEFLIGRLLADSLTNLGSSTRCGPPSPGSMSISTICGRWSPTRHSATAVSGASPPVSWRAWRPSPSPPMATASATTTASSARS